MENDALLRAKYPNMGSLADFETQLQNAITNNQGSASNIVQSKSVLITIPVIVHVVHNGEPVGSGSNISQAQVNSQIDVLNEDFRRMFGTNGYNTHPDGADIEIEFAMALIDPQGNTLPEPGIERVNGGVTSWNEINELEDDLKPQTQWDPNQYFNIWTVNYGGNMSTNLGYAQFPSLSGLAGTDANSGLAITDGVVCRASAFGTTGSVQAPFDGGRTLTHEVGHWLGLRHIWGDGDCSMDDYCNDTPQAQYENYGCPSENSCTLYAGDDMVENYMDYTDDYCMNIFTQDQKTRMRTVMDVCPRRLDLLSSTVHIPTNGPLAYFGLDKYIACSGSTINFTDYSTNGPTSWEWNIYDEWGNWVAVSYAQNPSFTFPGYGGFGVELIATNNGGSNTNYAAQVLTIISNQALTLPHTDDIEGVNPLELWTWYNPEDDREWDYANVSA
ncbi:MAG: hypothetical protein HRT72_03220, partial [Flavobacteriales bacterium]|nr:hypothetical protein [Flavobacteriales bacterium]